MKIWDIDRIIEDAKEECENRWLDIPALKDRSTVLALCNAGLINEKYKKDFDLECCCEPERKSDDIPNDAYGLTSEAYKRDVKSMLNSWYGLASDKYIAAIETKTLEEAYCRNDVNAVDAALKKARKAKTYHDTGVVIVGDDRKLLNEGQELFDDMLSSLMHNSAADTSDNIAFYVPVPQSLFDGICQGAVNYKNAHPGKQVRVKIVSPDTDVDRPHDATFTSMFNAFTKASEECDCVYVILISSGSVNIDYAKTIASAIENEQTALVVDTQDGAGSADYVYLGRIVPKKKSTRHQ